MSKDRCVRWERKYSVDPDVDLRHDDSIIADHRQRIHKLAKQASDQGFDIVGTVYKVFHSHWTIGSVLEEGDWAAAVPDPLGEWVSDNITAWKCSPGVYPERACKREFGSLPKAGLVPDGPWTCVDYRDE